MKKLISAIVILTLTVIIMSAAAVVSFAAEAPVAEWNLWTSEGYLKDVSKMASAECDTSLRACTFTALRGQNMTFTSATADERTALLNNVEYVHEGCGEDCEDHIKYMVITYSNPDGLTHFTQQDNAKNNTGSGSVQRKIPLKNTGDAYYSVIVNVSGDNATGGTLLRSKSTSAPTIMFYPTSGGSNKDTVYTMNFRSLAFTKTLDDAKAYCEGLWETGDSIAYHIDNEDGSTTGDLVIPEQSESTFEFDLYDSYKSGDELLLNYTGFLEEGYDDTEEAFHIKGTGSNRNTAFMFAPSTLNTDYNLALRKYMFSNDSDINYLVITYKNPDEWISLQHYYDYVDDAGKTQRIRSNAKMLKTEGTDYYSVILDLTGKHIFFPTNYVNSTTGPMMTFYPFNELASASTDEYDLYIRSFALTETLDEAKAYCEGLWESGDAVGYHVSDGTTTGTLFTPEAPVPMIDVTITAENGNVTVGGEAAAEQYAQGSELTLVATPADGYKFMGWYDVTGGLAPVGKYDLLSTNATYEFTVSEEIEITARFESEKRSDPIFVYDLYNNRETHKHVIHANNFTTSIYDSANEAYRVTGSGAQKEISFSLNSNSVDTSDAATEARAELIAIEKDIGYMVITYRNPDELANMSRRYINNIAGKDHYVYESFELGKSGDKYYSVIVDVSGERLWFRTNTAANQSQIALYPFMSLSEDDSETYALYFRQVALTKTLDDAKAYCEKLFATYESDGYHTVGGDLVEAPRLKLKLDKHVYRMSVGDELTLGVTVDKDDATITYESSNTSVATVAEVKGEYVITAVGYGVAEITVEGTKGEYIGADKIKIYVNDISPITVEKVADAPVAPATKPIISFLGDSITAGSNTDKTYHSYLADRLYITVDKQGQSGSNIAGPGSNDQDSFIERVPKIKEDTDLIFVLGGINDFGQNAGTLERFVPGIRTLIESLITRFPNKPIVFSTPLQNGGYFSTTTNDASETLKQYVDEIEAACEEYGIPVIKTYRNEVFDKFLTWDENKNVTGFVTDYFTYFDKKANEQKIGDGLHPNEAGHEIMADFFEKELEKAGVVKYVKYTTTTINAVSENMGTVTVGSGEAAETVIATEVTGTNITLTATANAGYKLEGWYDITNGKNVLLSRETSFVYTANKDAKIEARFMDETISIPVKLRAFVGKDSGGFISVNGNTEEDVNDYVNGSSTQELTAVPEEGYVFAYWKRVSCQSGTEIFMSADATLNAAPLGNAVYYMPVFVSEGTTLNLYLDAQELILGTEEPEIPSRLGYTGTGWNQVSEGEIVNVFKPVYVRADATTVLTIVYANAEPVEIAFKYDDQISIIGTLDNPIWTLTANGEETIISFDKKFTFGAAFTSNITLTETANDNGATANVNGVEAVYDSGAKLIKFVAMFTLPKEAILNERGILLTNDADVADDMELNTPNLIVGRVNSDPATATKTFIINKTQVNAGDTWYGRPYIVYTEGGVT
ncbi:MAG: SGNH/GDSL hydrolase family protein, partial [Clostridia bacterium]|nr:SGNH/GDSL hydrolase family protein [Clostridia bacterium]